MNAAHRPPAAVIGTPPAAPAPRKGDAFGNLPLAARLFVTGVVLAGGVAIGLSCALAPFQRPAAFLAFLAFSSLTAALKLPLPLKHGASSLSVSYAIDVAALLVLGPHEATLVTATSGWSQCTFRMRQRNPLHRTLFSVATLAVTMQAAGQVFLLIRGSRGDLLHGLAQPLGGAALVYYLLNTVLVAGAIALSSRQGLVRTWLDNFMWSAPSYFIGAATAALAKEFVARGLHYWWIGLIIVPGYLTYRSYRAFIARIEREQAQVRQASDVQMATIEALALAIEAKDRTSETQIRRMQSYVAGLARAVSLPEDDIPGLQTAALLHDIGNLAVPEHILSKPGPLTAEEFQKVRIHARVGSEILKNVPFPYPVASLILSHHEHWDGNGYPRRLKGEDIPLGARVLTIVDCYTALSSDRPHRPARQHHEALAAVREASGNLLDPRLVETFLDILPELEAQFAADAASQPPGRSASEAPEPAKDVLEDIAVAHHEARALYQIAQALGSSLGIGETMTLVERSLGGLVPFSCVALFLRREDRGVFECQWASGTGEEHVRQLSVPTLGSLDSREVLNRDGDGEPALRSMLVAPLTFDGAVIGGLTIYHVENDFYAPDHRRVLARVAEQAAPVIHNSIVFERTQADSFTDQLTGLPNRRYMQLHLDQQMARAERRRSKLAVVMLDLNDFKHINDDLGHQAGDRALSEIASVLRQMVRPYDLCARYGGDEFVVVLWECDGEQAGYRRDDIEHAVTSMYFEGCPGEARSLSVSGGVAVFPEDGDAREDLIATADRRMYERKAQLKQRTASRQAAAARS